ncbi:MAG: AAA family ATPase [Clostridiales bacterium]|nr:AAA family ATPase [Clostridiales bacterium]
MNFLNSGTGYALFSYEAQKKAYVDKSMLIHDVYRYAMETNRYICITRPRRFGKSVAANMLAAFFDASCANESRELFGKMEIGKLRKEQEKEWETGQNRSLCWPAQGKMRVEKRKYFFFDIDDTLLIHGDSTDGDYVPDSTKEALRLLEENGHFLAIATGRSYCMAKKYMTDLGFKNMVHDGGNGVTMTVRCWESSLWIMRKAWHSSTSAREKVSRGPLLRRTACTV